MHPIAAAFIIGGFIIANKSTATWQHVIVGSLFIIIATAISV
jgi:hypothetical protein